MEEQYKEIEGLSRYLISNLGTVYSKNKSCKMSTFVGKKNNYPMIKLIGDDGKRRVYLVHRLVAYAFVDNPNNFPEVNHKDKDVTNCVASNLEWCTRKQNLEYSNVLDDPVKNYRTCCLYDGDVLIGKFKSIKSAARYASKKFNISELSLEKYHKIKGCNIRIVPTSSEKRCCRTIKKQSGNGIKTEIYVKGKYHSTVSSLSKAYAFIKEVYGKSTHSNIYKDIEIRPKKYTPRKKYSNTIHIHEKCND